MSGFGWTLRVAILSFSSLKSGDMWWYDMKWYVMICGDLMGFERIWWLPSIRGCDSKRTFYIGGVLSKRIPQGKGMQRHCRSSLSSFSCRKAVPNFIVGICDDMIWNDMWWYVGIWWDLKGFDGFLHRASTCFKKNQKMPKNVRFWVDLEGCNFIVPKNCLQSGAFYRGGALQKDSTRQRHAKAL